MSEKTDDFIKTVGVLAKNEYMARDSWVLPSVAIAQAALESGWNLNASTLFGIKSNGDGASITAVTTEFYNGHYEEIQAAFRSYPNIAAAVTGYFDLITGADRYAGAICNDDYKDAIQKIWAGGYATDPNYVEKIVSIIEDYSLTAYDSRDVDSSSKDEENEIPGEETPASDVETYTVQPGDTLSSIAERYLGDESRYSELAQLNGIENPDVIFPGQIIGFPGSVVTDDSASSEQHEYIVEDGDTLWGLAQSLYGDGARYMELAKKNDIANPDCIYPGQVIKY